MLCVTILLGFLFFFFYFHLLRIKQIIIVCPPTNAGVTPAALLAVTPLLEVSYLVRLLKNLR